MNMKVVCKKCGREGGTYSSSDGVFPLTNKIDEYLCHSCDTMVRDEEYESKNTVYTEEGYRDIKCKNYELCKGTFDYRMVGSSCGIPGCKNYEYLCEPCYYRYGKWNGGKGELRHFDDVECPVCLETKRCIEQPHCDHTLCIRCFKNCYDGIFKEPTFPYTDDIKEQYEESEDPDSFMERYPLLIEYEKEYNRCLDAQEAMAELNGRCPLCRK